jgi:hypothetical protein
MSIVTRLAIATIIAIIIAIIIGYTIGMRANPKSAGFVRDQNTRRKWRQFGGKARASTRENRAAPCSV